MPQIPTIQQLDKHFQLQQLFHYHQFFILADTHVNADVCIPDAQRDPGGNNKDDPQEVFSFFPFLPYDTFGPPSSHPTCLTLSVLRSAVRLGPNRSVDQQGCHGGFGFGAIVVLAHPCPMRGLVDLARRHWSRHGILTNRSNEFSAYLLDRAQKLKAISLDVRDHQASALCHVSGLIIQRYCQHRG